MEYIVLQVIYCTEDMIMRSLWEAMHTTQPNVEDVKVLMFLAAYGITFI